MQKSPDYIQLGSRPRLLVSVAAGINKSCQLESSPVQRRNSGRIKRKREGIFVAGSQLPMAVGRYETPWNCSGHQYADGVVGLHEEIEDFFQYMIPTPQEHLLRQGIVGRIQQIVLGAWPHAKVETFGSFRTGLYLPTSDIDVVIYGKWEALPLFTLERLLEQHNFAKPGSLKVLAKASVPIIKLTDRLTDIKVDISFNMANGLRSAELVKHLKQCYPVLQKLVCVLKHFLVQRNLNEVFTGGLSSYALILMIVSFLELHPRHGAGTDFRANLGVLLIEFFELYGRNFNYHRTVIQLRHCGSYAEKINSNITPTVRPSGMLCIEDPLDPSNDVGRSSYGALQVKEAFERAYVTLTCRITSDHPSPNCFANCSTLSNSILSEIIFVGPEEIKFRQRISCNAVSSDDEQETLINPVSGYTFRTLSNETWPKVLSSRHNTHVNVSSKVKIDDSEDCTSSVSSLSLGDSDSDSDPKDIGKTEASPSNNSISPSTPPVPPPLASVDINKCTSQNYYAFGNISYPFNFDFSAPAKPRIQSDKIFNWRHNAQIADSSTLVVSPTSQLSKYGGGGLNITMESSSCQRCQQSRQDKTKSSLPPLVSANGNIYASGFTNDNATTKNGSVPPSFTNKRKKILKSFQNS